MTSLAQGKLYKSHLAFYEDVYGQQLVETHILGRIRATLMVSEQSAGDWSDAAVPDLVITRLSTAALPLTMDIGAGRRRFVAPTDSFVVVPPDYQTTFLMDTPHRVEFVGLHFRRLFDFVGNLGENTLPVDGDFGLLHDAPFIDVRVGQVMDAIWREVRSGNPHGALGGDGLVLQLLGALLEACTSQRASTAKGGLAGWQAKRLCDYLEEHLADDVSLDELAAMVQLSPSHLCRSFALTFGTPPHRWRMQRRIERGKELLAGTALSVTDIALICGFASSQHFAAAFRRMVGTTPSDYRKQRLR